MNNIMIKKRLVPIHFAFLGAIMLVGIFAALDPKQAQAIATGFEIQTIASGLNLPTTVAFAPDGRIFIAEKGGSIKIVKNGVLLAEPLITLSDINSYGDRGLIGMAIDPNFSQNGYLYLSYTYENTPGTSFSGIKTGRIVRITVIGDIAQESSKLVLVGSIGGNINTPSCDNYAVTSDCIPSDSPSHSVGGLRFGPDGKLYATTGDGSHFDYADVRSLRAQNLDSLAGKMLRINTDGTAPTNNPFYNGNPNSNRSKVYAYGLRNAFRFNFRPGTNALYAGDVGWSTWEEVNNITAGGNYGWPCREGNAATVGGLGCTATNPINPMYVYGHDVNGAGSITAGSFPTGNAYPASFLNTYFFGDYAQNWIKTMPITIGNVPGAVTDFALAADGTNGPVEFVTGPEGNIYFLAIYTGELKKITHTSGNRQPIVQISANPTSGLSPLSVNFSSAGSNDPDGNPITFLWNFGDNTTSTAQNPTHVYAANGVYTATLTVSDNLGGQQTKSIAITVGNQAPTAQISSPTAGFLYTPGNTITLTGSGIDPENGNLPASALSWRVILHHNIHIHILETHIGNNIPITAPDHADPDVYTEIELTVTDAAGLTNTKSINIYLNNASSGTGNLVDNANLETADPNNPNAPANWIADWWGNMNPIFTYPAPGYEGTNMRGAKIQITQYTSGDAKWQFAPVSAAENTTYTFSDYYTSNVSSTLVAEIGYINGTHSYINLGDVPANANWTKVTKTVTTPTGARNISILHLIDTVGTLSVDNFSLTLGTTPPPTDTTKPTVFITSPISGSTVSGNINIAATAADNVGVVGVKFLVDGVQKGIEDTASPYSVAWNTASSTNGTHLLSAVARDAAGNIATSTNTSVTVNNTTPGGPNLIANGNLESANGAVPTSWSKGGWGTNTRVLTYPITGSPSGKAARVEITAYPANGTGDAKWVHTKVPVTAGTQYTYTDRYRSNIISDIIGEYTMNDGTFHYFGLAKEIQPSPTAWNTVSGSFIPPTGATGITLYHLISSVGFVEIDDADMHVTGSGTPSETIPPVVEFTNPLNGQTVSGTVNITASSSDNVAVTYVFYAVDGDPITGQLTQSPYSFSWNTTTYSNGPHLLKATTHDPSGNNSTATITVNVNQSAIPDTTKPVVTLTSPTASSTVSGIVNMTANATDNVAVTGVKFLVDGVLTGAEDTTAPYAASWNTTSSSNGSHSVAAVARDAAGNTATSTVSVIVSNIVSPPSNNLILNPSLETASAGNANIPDKWQQGGYGTNTATFNYPVAGIDGARGANITVTAYTSGDRKWFFNDVSVTPGTPYTFTESYKSNVVTIPTVRYKSTTGAFTYVTLGNAPASPNWTTFSKVITPPTGTVAITIFHIINKVGTLDIDNYNLTAPGSADNVAPTVSLTSPTASSTVSGIVNMTANATDNVAVSGVKFLLDGALFGNEDTTTPYSVSWNTASSSNGSHSVVAIARDAAGNTATTSPVSFTVSNLAGDTTLPTVSFATPANGANVTGPLSVTVNGADNVALSSIQLFIDGLAFGSTTPTSPATWNINSTLYTNGTHTLLARAQDTSANIATTSIQVTFNNPTPDETPPVVSITSPGAGSTISGTVAVTISATDNVGISDVHILIDGENIGIDATFPYGASIDTTSLQNGPHEITAYGEDVAGNIGNAVPVSITVSNIPINPPAPNLVLNPSLETPDPANPSVPENWFKGFWGTHNAAFTYPTTGINGARAARIDITSYTDGDAKWFFKDATVTPGEVYAFQEQYKSNVPTTLTARFTYADDSVQYRDIITLPASAAWTTSETNIVVPPGAVKMTLFHIIGAVGFLEVDDYYLSTESAPSTNTFPQGMVSLTFDDGWLSQYTFARPILNNASIKGSFYIISQESIEAVPNNRIQNANFETANSGNPALPESWTTNKTGTNDAVFTYPTAGVSGSAVRIDVTNYSSGEAQWIPDLTTVISGQEYTYSGSYKSDASTKVMVKYVLNDNSVVINEVGTLSPATNWTSFNYKFTVATGLKNITVYHSLRSSGFITVDNVDLNRVMVFVNPTQIQQMWSEGHEIGAHTRTHADLAAITPAEASVEVNGSRSDLLGLGLFPVDTFVYPYGSYNPAIQQIVKDAGFIGSRSTDIGYNLRDTDKYALQIQQVDNTTTFAQFQTWVDTARNNKTWLILMFHQVDNQNLQLGVTPALFQQMTDFLVQQQVNVVTTKQGLGQMLP